MPRAPRLRVAAVALAAGATLLASPTIAGAAAPAPASVAETASTTTTSTTSTTITVQPGTVGSGSTQLPSGFVGLSVPPIELTTNSFAGLALRPYLKTLGPTGVIRVGGNSEDTTFWTSTGETPPSWSAGTVTPALLEPLAAIVKHTGWKIILGLNLKEYDPARAADEAKYAKAIFGSSLLAVEIGNEPTFYYSSTSAYFTAFEAYVSAIEQAAPGVGITGPDPDHNHAAFLDAFAANEAPHPDVLEVTDHVYPQSICGGTTVTIPQLLSTASEQNELESAQAVVGAAKQDGVPAAVTETNSVVCAGEPGVSNVFASSLWALDYDLLLAQNGVVNADYEGGIAGCDAYAPLCPAPDGVLAAQPVYYGMLATRLVGTGTFLDVTNPDAANVRAYAVQNGRTLTVVLDNFQDPSANGPTDVTLDLGGGHYRHAAQTLLQTSSPDGLAAATDITLGGHAVSGTGQFPAPDYTPVPVHGDTATVTVQAGSATILKFTD